MSTYTIGNWVTFEDGTNHQITSKSSLSYTFDNNFSCGFETHTVLSMKPWQPKSGDWCWFWDDSWSYVQLLQFNKMDKDIFESKTSVEIGNVDCDRWSKCEPFIGQLPSICKE